MKKSVFTVLFILISFILIAGEEGYHRVIKWKDIQEIRVNEEETVMMAYFTGGQYTNESGGIPLYAENFPLPVSA